VIAVGYGRRVHEAAEAYLGATIRVRWRKRGGFALRLLRGDVEQEHDFLPPPAKLTSKAVEWATTR
jgi:hypothetical protein